MLDFGEDIGVPDDFSDQEISSGAWWRHLVAGGVAGAVSRTCTAPLDRLKIFLQVQFSFAFRLLRIGSSYIIIALPQVHGGRKSLTIRSTLLYLYREGGFAGLWRGNGMNVIKIAPESALKFGSYDVLKRFIRGDADRDMLLWERFLAGSLAGGFSQSVIYPFEVRTTASYCESVRLTILSGTRC
jgi:solute carrier family 25 phosphate transporter 23/24/25/41